MKRFTLPKYVIINAFIFSSLIGATGIAATAVINATPPALPPAQALPATAPPTTISHKNLNPYKVIRTTPSMLESTLNRLVNNGYAVTGILSTINQEKFTIIAFRPSPG